MKRTLRNLIIVAGVALSTTSCVISHQSGVSQAPVGSKVGVATKSQWFGFGNANVGLQEAAKNGNITTIGTYSHSVRKGLFRIRYKTIVSGE